MSDSTVDSADDSAGPAAGSQNLPSAPPGPDQGAPVGRVHEIIEKMAEGGMDEALDLAQALAADNPERAEPYHLLGLAAFFLGDPGRAAQLIRHAHERDPECREYADALAAIHTLTGNLAEGLYYAKLSVALEPHPEISGLLPEGMDDYFKALAAAGPPRHLISAMMSFNRRQFKHAAEYCGRALRIDGRDSAAHLLLAKTLMEMHEPDRAIAALHSVLHLEPESDHAEARLLLADCLDRLGRLTDADTVREAACALDPDSDAPARAAVRAAPFRPGVTQKMIQAAEDRFAERLEREAAAAEPDLMGSLGDSENPKTRIGYIGAVFHDCADAVFFRDVIRAHGPQAEVRGYQHSFERGELVTHLESSAADWRRTTDLEPEVIASIIAGDGIDGLVDLGGYSGGMPLEVMAAKAAKLQVGWLNHTDGAGSRTIDLILSDPMTIDLDEAGLRGDQVTLMLGGGILALRPPEIFTPPGESPAHETGRVTFGAAADLERVNIGVAGVWSDILRRTPGARIVMRAPETESGTVTDRISEMFAHFGMMERVKFFHSENGLRIDPKFFSGIDIYLDPFPMPLPEDAALSLWAGAPAVTLKGPTRQGRFGACVLNSAGRAEWIADDEAAYADIAAALAADTAALSEIRAGLRDSVRGAPLFNPQILAAGIEAGVSTVLETRSGAPGADGADNN